MSDQFCSIDSHELVGNTAVHPPRTHRSCDHQSSLGLGLAECQFRVRIRHLNVHGNAKMRLLFQDGQQARDELLKTGLAGKTLANRLQTSRSQPIPQLRVGDQ